MTEDTQAQQIADLEGSEGFIKRRKSNWMRFEVFDGSICIKHDGPGVGVDGEPLEGPIETQNPRTRAVKNTWVDRFDSLVVKIVDVNRYQKEFDDGGKVTNYNFTVQAPNKKRATLQMTYMDPFLQKFLKVAPNIDFNKYIRFGVFKKDKKLLISIKQGDGPNYDDWPAVPFYWQHEVKDGRPDYKSVAQGADGSILPDAIHDEDTDEWDFRAQKKFLITHFKENTMPKIKAIAKELGIEGFKPDGEETPEFSGPAQAAIPIVTERPAVLEALGLDDAMTSGQASELRKLCKRVNKDPDTVIKAALKEDFPFDNLSIAGAAYLKHRLEKLIEKNPEKYPDPEPKLVVPKKKDDDDWDTDSKVDAVINQDDDDDWGTAAPKVKSAFHDDDDDE